MDIDTDIATIHSICYLKKLLEKLEDPKPRNVLQIEARGKDWAEGEGSSIADIFLWQNKGDDWLGEEAQNTKQKEMRFMFRLEEHFFYCTLLFLKYENVYMIQNEHNIIIIFLHLLFLVISWVIL